MNLTQAQQLLNDHGYPAGPADGIYGPKTRQALQHFQLATTHGPPHAAGDFDPTTVLALEQLPKLAPHFTTTEIRSKGNGNSYIRRELLYTLEAMREIIGRPCPIHSGYRDAHWNASIPGSATNSLHMYGLAVDVHSQRLNVTLNQARAMKLFSGIGWNRTTGLVSHLDVRHLTGRHTDTPTNPRTWRYNR